MTSYAPNHRRILRNTEAVQRVVDADARFFERRPWRSHRVRHAAQAELKLNAASLGLEEIETEPGQRWFVAVKQIEPGVRTRLFVQNAVHADPDMDEHEAAAVYDWLARNGSSQALKIEAQLRHLVEKGRV